MRRHKRIWASLIWWGCVILMLAVWLVHWTGLGRFWTTDQAAIAREGKPIVQAVYEFKRQRGTWPISLGELVPQYLPSEEAAGWSYSNGFLSTATGIPHTGVCYDFARPDEGWQSKGDYGTGKLDVAAPLATQPGDIPVFDRGQE